MFKLLLYVKTMYEKVTQNPALFIERNKKNFLKQRLQKEYIIK